jgi:ABC-type molybdate transport system substrate-binding protein
VPPEANVPATYAGVVVKASAAPAAAAAFLAWLAGPGARPVFANAGFTTAP